MRQLNQNFTRLKDLKSSAPVTLAVFHFSSGDVFVSDRALKAGDDGPEFTGLVISWGSLSTPANGLFSVGLPEIRLELANAGTPAFSSYLEGGAPEGAEVELFQWFEGLSYSDKELIGRFVVASPVVYNEATVRLSLVSALIKHNRIVGKKISREEYPGADPDAVGRMENIIYGAPRNVACPAITAGGYSTLASDISGPAAVIEISGNSSDSAFPAAPFTVICDYEEMLVTSKGQSPYKTWTVTRGQNGTTAALHKKGAAVYEKRSDYTFLVAGHPVKSIGDVYVEGVRVVSGVTKNANASGRATLVFSNKFTLEKSVDLQIQDTTGVTQGNHSHQSGGYIQRQGGSGSHYPSAGINWSGVDSAMYDGGNSGPKLHGDSASWPSGNYMRVNFPAWTGGTIRSVRVCLTYEKYLSSGGRTIKFQGQSLDDTSGITTVKFDNGTSYPGYIQCVADVFHNGHIDIYEMWLEVQADTLQSAADGVGKTGAVTLNGNSSADVVVGGLVTCDVEGYQDDSGGTYTGTPYALIENPSDVVRHFMVNYMGLPSGEFDTSFVSARTALSQAVSGGYRFAGVVDSPVDALDLLEDWSAQARLKIRHDGNKARLSFLTNIPAVSNKTLHKAMIGKDGLQLGRTGKEEVINLLSIHYLRDFSMEGNPQRAYTALAGSSQLYPADGDLSSVALYGPRSPRRPYFFGFISGPAVASDLRDFYITRFKDIKRRAVITLFLDNFELEEGDVIELDYPSSASSLAGAKFYVENITFTPGSRVRGRADEVRVQAREV